MLAKRTAKNQLTLPKAIVQATGEADYYDISTENGRIVLTPVRLHQAEAVREKLAICAAVIIFLIGLISEQITSLTYRPHD